MCYVLSIAIKRIDLSKKYFGRRKHESDVEDSEV